MWQKHIFRIGRVYLPQPDIASPQLFTYSTASHISRFETRKCHPRRSVELCAINRFWLCSIHSDSVQWHSYQLWKYGIPGSRAGFTRTSWHLYWHVGIWSASLCCPQVKKISKVGFNLMTSYKTVLKTFSLCYNVTLRKIQFIYNIHTIKT